VYPFVYISPLFFSINGFLVQVIGSLIAIVCALASRCEKKKNVKRHSSKHLEGQLPKATATRSLLPDDSFPTNCVSSADGGASNSDRNYALGNNTDISSQILTIQNQLSVCTHIDTCTVNENTYDNKIKYLY
jgi:hypothetical protein